MQCFQYPYSICRSLFRSNSGYHGNKNYDILIIGGGIVGLATGRELTARYPEKTIALVEKEEVLGTIMKNK